MTPIGPGTRIPWRHITPDSVRRGGVSRLVGVTKPFPRWGMAFFWHQNSVVLVHYRDSIPYDDREIVLRASESRENPTRGPGRSGCVAIIPTRMKGLLVSRGCGLDKPLVCGFCAFFFVLALVLAVFVCVFVWPRCWARGDVGTDTQQTSQ